MSFAIRRTIEIDMGHRVSTHGSKCWNLHGHRYVIEAEVRSKELKQTGHESGMVMDFGFLKQFMISQIHDYCDHGLCLWVKDPVLNIFMTSNHAETIQTFVEDNGFHFIPENKNTGQFKMLIVPFIPTAEHLAEFWFNRLDSPIRQQYPKLNLNRLYVWETPNSVAIYPSSIGGVGDIDA